MNSIINFILGNTTTDILLNIINILVLVIPIIALILIAIFLPWYFKKRVHIMNKTIELEEEKINIEEMNLSSPKSPGDNTPKQD
jgi:hypothetical protein